MMKEKQIEEMAEIIGDNTEFDTMWDEIEASAEALYNAGYRKVPEGAIVLTRSELDALNKYQERFKGEDAEAVIATEVAREILSELYNYCHEKWRYAKDKSHHAMITGNNDNVRIWHNREVAYSDMSLKIRELKKKYTEGEG